jgi:REP element-mobilizing transposase RayT
MPAPPRILLPKTLVFVSTRIEEGLPLVCAEFMCRILWGILARAQTMHPVKVVAFEFMNNHFHMLLLVENPSDVVAFVDRVKTESAHAINHLLGRRKKTIWEDSYDSPTILTPEDAVQKLVYTYTNAQEAELIETAEEYPGLSSWDMFMSGQHQKSCKWIRRPMIKPLKTTKLTIQQQNSLANELEAKAQEQFTFTVFPDAWMECFKLDSSDRERYRELIIQKVRQKEQELRNARASAGKKVMGREKLLLQPMDTPYTPKKFGRRMWCICHDKALRKAFIQFVKGLISEARRTYQRWKMGDSQARYPIGLFPPCFPKIAEILPVQFG